MNTVHDLICSVRSCSRCYGDEGIYVPLPDPRNCTSKAKVMFVNERPGRIGTGASGYVSFDNDDPSANFFKECFETTGLDRSDIYITNACLCHPDFPGYRDTAPKVKELEKCHYWLKKQIELVDPELVVTVGKKAWESVLRYFGLWSTLGLKRYSDIVGQPIQHEDICILPVAHTSRLGRANRAAEKQRKDWLMIPRLLQSNVREAP